MAAADVAVVAAEPEPELRKSSLTLHALRRVARPAVLTSNPRRITRQSLAAATDDAVEANVDEPETVAVDIDSDETDSEIEEAPKRAPSRRSSRRSSAVSAPEPAAPVAAPQTRQVTVAKQTPFGVLMETKTIVVDADGNEIKPAAAGARQAQGGAGAPQQPSVERQRRVGRVRCRARRRHCSRRAQQQRRRRGRRREALVAPTHAHRERHRATASTARATRSSRRLTRTLSQVNEADAVVAAVADDPAPKRRPTTRRTTRSSMLVDQSDVDDGHVSEPVASRRLTRSAAASRVVSEDEAEPVAAPEQPPAEPVAVAPVATEPPKRALRGRCSGCTPAEPSASCRAGCRASRRSCAERGCAPPCARCGRHV
jgi:hypothetical protein